MRNALSLITCYSCAGSGVNTTPQGISTCLVCNGAGLWIQNDKKQTLILPIPDLIKPETVSSEQYKKLGRYSLYGIGWVTTALSLITNLSQSTTGISGVLWGPEFTHTSFGIGGLISVWSLYSMANRRASTNSLDELSDDNAYSGNLKNYCNPRFEELLKATARTADSLHYTEINEHILLLTLLRQPRIQTLLARLEFASENFEDLVMSLLPTLPPKPITSVQVSPLARNYIYQGFLYAYSNNLPYFDIESIFLSYLGVQSAYKDTFEEAGLHAAAFQAVARWFGEDELRHQSLSSLVHQSKVRQKGYMNRAWTALPTPFLDAYSQDLTRSASYGRIPAVSVRNNEITRILAILSRTKKNSVLLVGEPGVGKQSLIGGIATQILTSEVPDLLRDKRLVSMELSALLSGDTTPQGNIQQIIDEVSRAGNVILAIPDIRALVQTSGNTLDAATLLSSALNKGYLQVIATATYAEYHRYVESNPGLSSLLDIVEIKEVTAAQALQILEEEAPRIEGQQSVWLTYPALEAAVKLAKQYIPDKVLPDSALSLLDETASLVRTANRKMVSALDVEQAIEQKTGIPVQKAQTEEAGKLLDLEAVLHTRVIGQDVAISAVANAIRRARAGLHTGNRPISSFLFVGPTGVGKTETAKALAQHYYGSEAAVIRLDMSEYQDNRSIYRLIGAPAGAQESTEGGALTQAIREKPFSLVLLDELEKAHADVLNLFLQVLDDGRLTENTGRTISFSNTIIIATSNAGTAELAQLFQMGLSLEDLPKQTMQVLTTFFKPEFLNRFDAVIPFRPLTQEEILKVVELLALALTEKVRDQGYTLDITPEALSLIANQGYDPQFGARPLRRFIQDKVETIIADTILKGQLQPNETLRITAEMIQ